MLDISCPLEWLHFQNWTLILYGTTSDPFLGNNHLRTTRWKPDQKQEKIGMD